MTHVAIFDSMWQHVDHYLTSSAPCDGQTYDFKCWIMRNVSEPLLETMYFCALTTHKPLSALAAVDILGDDAAERISGPRSEESGGPER